MLQTDKLPKFTVIKTSDNVSEIVEDIFHKLTDYAINCDIREAQNIDGDFKVYQYYNDLIDDIYNFATNYVSPENFYKWFTTLFVFCRYYSLDETYKTKREISPIVIESIITELEGLAK